jgi:hypothetical protein
MEVAGVSSSTVCRPIHITVAKVRQAHLPVTRYWITSAVGGPSVSEAQELIDTEVALDAAPIPRYGIGPGIGTPGVSVGAGLGARAFPAVATVKTA